MEITIKKEVEQKVNIETPYYFKDVCFWYLVTETNYVQIYSSGFDTTPHISVSKGAPRDLTSETAVPITKQEFNEVLENAITNIKNITT